MTAEAKGREAILADIFSATEATRPTTRVNRNQRCFDPHRLIKEFDRDRVSRRRARAHEEAKAQYGESVNMAFVRDLAASVHISEELVYKAAAILTREMGNALARREPVSMGSMGWIIPWRKKKCLNTKKAKKYPYYTVWFEHDSDFLDSLNGESELDLSEFER